MFSVSFRSFLLSFALLLCFLEHSSAEETLDQIKAAFADQDYDRVLSIGESSCRDGDPAGCNAVGLLALNGLGMRVDLEGARLLFKVACDSGYLNACLNFITTLDTNASGDALPEGTSDVYTKVRKLEGATDGAELLCDRGVARLCKLSAELYRSRAYGEGRDINELLKSITLYTKACRLGSRISCVSAGSLIVRTEVFGEKSFDNATVWFEEGCNQDYGHACGTLGLHYEQRMKNDYAASEAYEASCALNDAGGCFSLARMQRNGSGGESNLEAASANHRKACSLARDDVAYANRDCDNSE